MAYLSNAKVFELMMQGATIHDNGRFATVWDAKGNSLGVMNPFGFENMLRAGNLKMQSVQTGSAVYTIDLTGKGDKRIVVQRETVKG